METNPETQKHIHVSAETHSRINNNNDQVIWQVRRNGSDVFQADYNQYVGDILIQSKHLNNYKKANYYTNYTFNSNGTPALEETYSFDGVLNEKVTYSYNDAGLLTKKDEHFADPTGAMNVEISELHTYGKIGKVTKTEVIEYGEKYSVEYVYNSEGNVMAKTQTPASKTEPPYLEQYSYENGLLTGKDIFEGKSKEPSENDEFEYNNKGDLVKAASYEKGQLREVTLYEYFD